MQSRSLISCNSIKTFDFSTLYASFPHSKLKVRLKEFLCFIKRNGQRRYKYLVLGRDRSYYVTCFSTEVGTNCASLLVDFFLYSYDADFIQRRLKKSEKKLARSFNFTFRYIDDVLSLNYSRFGDFVDRIYLIELEIKDTTDTDRSASYLDLHLEIDSGGWLRTILYDKRDDFNFPIVNFPLYVATFEQHPHMEYTSLN